MHPQQRSFCERVKNILPEYFINKKVLDVGSLDVNGNNRYLFENCDYTGIDVSIGPNVDFASRGHEWVKPSGIPYDTIISTECFEHDMFYEKTLKNISYYLLTPGGLFLFTCATDGRPEHGTLRTTPQDSPLTTILGNEWSNYYKNLNQIDIENSIDLNYYFKDYKFEIGEETKDLYFWGIKKLKYI